MAKDQPEVAGVVVAFVARLRHAVYLTPRDRMDVHDWREAAREAGFDRMIIHDHEPGDDPDFGDFLCLHRRGEAWSRWGFARDGETVTAWSTLSSKDAGTFSTMREAFECVLLGMYTRWHRAG